MKEVLMNYKYSPRIMELRLALLKRKIVAQYGEEMAMSYLKMLSDMFQCNWTLLIGIFNKDVQIVRYSSEDAKRRKQTIIFMGALYGESRYAVAKHYLNMSVNYLYQIKTDHNPDDFATPKWIERMEQEVVVCGIRSYAVEAKRFLVSFDAFMGVFK